MGRNLDPETLRAVKAQFEDMAPHELAEWVDRQLEAAASPAPATVGETCEACGQIVQVGKAHHHVIGIDVADSPPAEETLLDRWDTSGLPTVARFNHAVDVANATYRVNMRLHDERRDLRAKLATARRDAFAETIRMVAREQAFWPPASGSTARQALETVLAALRTAQQETPNAL